MVVVVVVVEVLLVVVVVVEEEEEEEENQQQHNCGVVVLLPIIYLCTGVQKPGNWINSTTMKKGTFNICLSNRSIAKKYVKLLLKV